MTNTLHQQSLCWRYFWLAALISLPAIGWWGVLDDFSSTGISTSISNAGVIYGTARGINALVSLLQGTELNVPFVTFTIGEVLDPVNDLIERFSQVVLIAFGSLALQKILLAIVSHTMFNVLISIAAACTGLSIFIGHPRLISALLRTFLVIVFFRFSLGLVVLANSWVDAAFLDEADQQRHIAMEDFHKSLRKIDSFSKAEVESAELLAEIEEDKQKLAVELRGYGHDLDSLDARIEVASKNLDRLIEQAGGICKITNLFNSCPPEATRQKDALKKLESQRAPIVREIATTEEAIELLGERADCVTKRQGGETCSFWESLPDAPNPAELRQKLNQLNDSLSEFAEDCINLIMSLLLKTIVIPLLFFYLLLKVFRMNWAKL